MWWKKDRKIAVSADQQDRDWTLMQHLLLDSYAEQKKARRWGIVFKLLTFSYLFILLGGFYFSMQQRDIVLPTEPHVAVIKLEGIIAADNQASGGKISHALREAFENEHAEAVILAINSPGGSPVQSGYIYDEIIRLKDLYPEKKLYAVIADIGASGGYYVAAAADEIYANRASLVGSIGVTASGFGFVEAIDKLGVERRHFTAGEHKAFLDPFSPVKEGEKAFWQGVLADVHQQFIQAVEQGRGDKVELTEELTSGLIWNGEQALQLGLIDGLASVRGVARDIVGQEELRDYTLKVSPFHQLIENFGVSIGKGAAGALRSEAHLQLR